MIPILYEANESEFMTGGICRLFDCISCTVTEERNGGYECDFTYPVSGAYFDEIKLGRIISVTHDDTGDRQPFDIISYTKPIEGLVEFHAVHISYRQSKIVASGANIQSLSDAFDMLSSGTPYNPFVYSSDFESTANLTSADGTPRSVRQFLGGMEGSILDTYGGEYEWNAWSVRLHRNRGEAKEVTIRYGINMTGYQDESDFSESYSAVIPYWSGTDANNDPLIVKGGIVTGGASYNGRIECVPMDLTSKFESEPTVADLEDAARAMLLRQDPTSPKQTITVESVADLEGCRLCDTVQVVFPRYGMEGRYKIVRTVWDVLLDRFTSMELGSLATTLSEALGIESSLNSNGSGGSSGEGVDYIIETNTSNGWLYRKWNSGLAECWKTVTITAQTNSSDAGGYVSASAADPGDFPFTFASVPNVQVTVSSGGITGSVTSVTRPTTQAAGTWRLYRNSSNTNAGNKDFMFYAVGMITN